MKNKNPENTRYLLFLGAVHDSYQGAYIIPKLVNTDTKNETMLQRIYRWESQSNRNRAG